MRRVLWLTLALLLVTVARPGSSSEAEGTPFTMAVLRQDGILLPFVSWTGDGWANPWPVPLKAATVPITFTDIPKQWWHKREPLPSWHAWQVDGTQSAVRVTATA